VTAQAQPDVDHALKTKVALLKKPGSYPDSPARIQTIETHMSWVFLTDRYAYKLKKPVRYPYLDFSSLEARERYCREEYRLNQQLAPGVYLGVVPLCVDDANIARVGGEGRVVEWLVKMRRLPGNRMLDQLIKAHRLAPRDLDPLAAILVRFYSEARLISLDAQTYRARFSATIARNRDILATPNYELPAEQVRTVHERLLTYLETVPELFDRRAREGRIVEGHGDLRPEHVCLETRPIIFDRLEFNRDLRVIDPVDELSFLSMECERLGAAFVRDVLFGAYARVTGDAPPQTLVSFYMAHRACLRARLAALHTVDAPPSRWPQWLTVAADYLRIATDHSERLTGTAADSPPR
jgi:aminoglycoside phosphotransferase family enzyme